MNSLKVGKIIYSLLINDVELNKKVKKRVYPLIADIDTNFPFIVYKRNGIDVTNTKDRYNIKEDAIVEIIIASDKYNECVEIASLVADILHNKKGTFDDLICKKILLISADEDYLDGAFIQKLNVNIQII